MRAHSSPQQPGVEDTAATMIVAVSRVALDAHGGQIRWALARQHGPSGGFSSRINAHWRKQCCTNNDNRAWAVFPPLWLA